MVRVTNLSVRTTGPGFATSAAEPAAASNGVDSRAQRAATRAMNASPAQGEQEDGVWTEKDWDRIFGVGLCFFMVVVPLLLPAVITYYRGFETRQ